MIPSTPAKWTKEDVLLTIERWQKRLNLGHWRIQLSNWAPKNKDALLEVNTNRNRNHASIRISEDACYAPDRTRLVVHELLHLVFDPLREEYDFQKQLLPEERREEYESRFMRQLERAVEHLSHVL